MIKNIESIAEIEAKKTITLFCPIGKDYYIADITITFLPNEYYMDYIDLDNFLLEISGLSLTIEQAAQKIYEWLAKYKPFKRKVTINAHSNTHLNVKVSKGD